MADDTSALTTTGRATGRSGSQTTGQPNQRLDALNSLASNFDNFLTILTTQLQNQDPLSPLDTHEFTNQLVMFADVEQSVRQSRQLDDLIALQRQNEVTGAVGYIGQKISANHNEVNFDGKTGMDLAYTLPEKAKTAALQIYDSKGELVRLISGADTGFGRHSIRWDGRDNNGNPVPSGAYAFQIGAINDNDQPITATYETRGTVTGVDINGKQTSLLMGDVKIPINRVLRVEGSET